MLKHLDPHEGYGTLRSRFHEEQGMVAYLPLHAHMCRNMQGNMEFARP